MNLAKIRDAFIDDGYSFEAASVRACQDAFLSTLASSEFANKVTFKGGIVMRQVSGDKRRATQDIDFDFMRYSINADAIYSFINKLNDNIIGINIRISGPIEKLKHQDYNGKRVHVILSDGENNEVTTKLDIGVHTNFSMKQRLICFDIMASDESISLLGNTDEQMVAEKMRSLLRIGIRSTRYKDVFDIYYHLCVNEINLNNLSICMTSEIFSDKSMRESNWSDVHSRLEKIFSEKRYISHLSNSKDNWLEIPVEKVVDEILSSIKLFASV